MSVADSLRGVLARLAQLSLETKRPPAQLIAVTKTQSPATVLQAYEAGQRVFGENYVAELVAKAPQLPPDVQWHFIGHLQSNKVKTLIEGVPNLACVEGLESAKLASKLDAAWKQPKPLSVLIQINTSSEASKDGIEPEEAADLVRFVIEKCPRLSFSGLMTIGKLGDTTSACFDLLVKTRDDLLTQAIPGLPAKESFVLSMGMSGDYELAVRSGSTSVRVGSSIFGSRPPKVSASAEPEKAEPVKKPE